MPTKENEAAPERPRHALLPRRPPQIDPGPVEKEDSRQEKLSRLGAEGAFRLDRRLSDDRRGRAPVRGHALTEAGAPRLPLSGAHPGSCGLALRKAKGRPR